MPLEGLLTISISRFQPSMSHDLAGSAAEGAGRIVGVEGQTHAGLLGYGDDRFEEIGDVSPHFVECVRAFRGAAADPSCGRKSKAVIPAPARPSSA